MSAIEAASAPSFNSRLSSACNCAYGISADDGSYNPPAIYDAAVNWEATPTPVAARKQGDDFGPFINACLVGLNQDGIIVAFRGTLPPALTVASFEDWWQDIAYSAPVSAAPLPGKVHAGFWSALETIWPGVLTAIETLTSAHPDTPIYVTGHSKGGPMATLGAARLFLSRQIKAQSIVTFASPYPGDVTFVSGYPPELLPIVRFENYLDMVPFIPPTDAFFQFFDKVLPHWLQKDFCKLFPTICGALENASEWNYACIGTLNFITSTGDVVEKGDYRANVHYRLAQIVAELFGLDAETVKVEDLISIAQRKHSDTGFTRIGAAHCIACKSDNPKKYCAGGYMTGSGGDVICPTP